MLELVLQQYRWYFDQFSLDIREAIFYRSVWKMIYANILVIRCILRYRRPEHSHDYSANLQSLFSSQQCGKEVRLGEEGGPVSNSIFRQDLFTSLQKGPFAKGFLIPSCSPTKTVLDPECKQPFMVAFQGSQDPAWQGLQPKKLNHLFFFNQVTEVQKPPRSTPPIYWQLARKTQNDLPKSHSRS